MNHKVEALLSKKQSERLNKGIEGTAIKLAMNLFNIDLEEYSYDIIISGKFNGICYATVSVYTEEHKCHILVRREMTKRITLNHLLEQPPVDLHKAKIVPTDDYVLPKNIIKRLKKLREEDPISHADKRFNKTSKYVIFAKQKLDTLDIKDLTEVLLKQWSQDDVKWLLKLLGYSIDAENGLAGYRVYEITY